MSKLLLRFGGAANRGSLSQSGCCPGPGALQPSPILAFFQTTPHQVLTPEAESQPSTTTCCLSGAVSPRPRQLPRFQGPLYGMYFNSISMQYSPCHSAQSLRSPAGGSTSNPKDLRASTRSVQSVHRSADYLNLISLGVMGSSNVTGMLLGLAAGAVGSVGVGLLSSLRGKGKEKEQPVGVF